MRIVEIASSPHHKCRRRKTDGAGRCWCDDLMMVVCDRPYPQDLTQTCDVISFAPSGCEDTEVTCTYCKQPSVVTAL